MDRKEMIRLLEAHSGAKAKYMGVPSFDYQIGIHGETYTIGKDCIMRNEAGEIVDYESVLQSASEGEPEECIPTAELRTGDEVNIAVPMEGHTGATLRNLVNMIFSKQVHLKKALKIETDIVSLEFVEAVNDEEVKTMEHFKQAMLRVGVEKCPGIGFDFDEGSVVFKFIISVEESEMVDAVTRLVALLSKSAKEQKYASFKPSADDNVKFTMRTWLIRLGFVGGEYKAARKAMLKSLEGNGAFRRSKPSEEVVAE
ncbi:MAG: virulence-related protein [Clostridia bacterium]|nr:virulence-related protein [Clostridia bacterium]